MIKLVGADLGKGEHSYAKNFGTWIFTQIFS